MTFNVLSLKSTFAAGDQQYISDFNTNFGNVTTMFTDARADIDSLSNLQGQKIVDDVLRKISASDKSGGALGPYSFAINLGTPNTIRLTHDNADAYSYGYIGMDRFSTNATLQYDMSSQSTDTYYVGITGDSSTGDVTIQVNAVEGQISLPLYSVDYDGASNTLTNPKRINRTVLFSNTLLQSMLEVPNLLHIQLCSPNSSITNGSASTFNDLTRFSIPYDHVWSGGRLNMSGNYVTGSSSFIHITDSAGNDVMEVPLGLAGTDPDFAVKADYVDKTMAAGTNYSIGVDLDNNEIVNPSVTLNFLQSFNVPVV